MKKFFNGQLVFNKLSNGNTLLCRVVEFVDAVGMYRITDARESAPDAELIRRNLTWAAPLENIVAADRNQR